MAKVVYNLWFEREYPDRDATELHIGIYETEADAKAAIELLRQKPGFREFPQGFTIYEAKLGMTGWQSGFITKYEPVITSDIRTKAFDLPAFAESAVADALPSNDR